MLSGILSPAFLQAAGNRRKIDDGITLYSATADPSISSISCEGEITVTTTKNGAPIVQTYSDLDGYSLSIQADPKTKISITGKITGECKIGNNTSYTKIYIKNTALTSLSCNDCYALQELNLSTNTALTSLSCNNCNALQELNLSTNTALTSLSCDSCNALQELNLSTNTALTSLNCNDCKRLISISYPATNSSVSTKIAGAITAADSTVGTVYTDSAAAYYNTIATAATTKGWTIAQIAA